jgi:sigma-B regulation protein RsbU (phosphoserine phosphatase)
VNEPQQLLADTAEELFEDAPCGYLSTELDGTIVRVNRTFESWSGFARARLLAGQRFQDLLSPGGRIYYETHFSPLLQMQGSVSEVAVEIVRADGSRLPALVNAVLRRDERGGAHLIRTTVFDATDRRRYEQELLRARRREQDIAQQLQRSLLAGELPVDSRLQVEVCYQPGVSGLEVGGDWHDAFWLDDGETVGLVVGDAVGRGLQAAASMGQLRSAVRALASTGLAPSALLEAMDGYAHRHQVGQVATLVFAQLSLSSGRLCFACAGHPPPLAFIPGEAPRFLWQGRSTPLDVFAAPRSREQASLQLPPGSTLLLYSDGLIERRSLALDEGMARLLREAEARLSETPSGHAAAIVRALHGGDDADDVCLLSARLLE